MHEKADEGDDGDGGDGDYRNHNASQVKMRVGHDTKTLDDQQWMLERMKIGLKTKPLETMKVDMHYGIKHFVQTHFKRKECVQFIPQETGDQCECGLKEENHKTIEELNEESDKLFGVKVLSSKHKHDREDQQCEKDHHIQEFPSNAYGRIEFEEGQTAKYVRLADNTSMGNIRDFITSHDKSLMNPKPLMALSIVGGAKNFKIDGCKREIFKKGVIAAAQATNAWIISGGTNTGCMKLIGEIAKEGQYFVSDGIQMRRGIRTIGICSWGYVAHKESLVNTSSSHRDEILTTEGLKTIYQVHYSSEREGVKPPLDPNHFRFFMVDDGFRRKHLAWHSESKFRADFEKMIRKQEPEGLDIPILTLLLEGGTDAIYDVMASLEQGAPCVIIEGSGRAADILAYAYRHADEIETEVNKQKQQKESNGEGWWLNLNHMNHLATMLENCYGDKFSEENKSDWINEKITWILKIIMHSDRITLFDINSEDDTCRDKKILCALLKNEHLTVQNKMMMSLMWNRADIAEEMIINDPKIHRFDEVMSQALMMENVKFIEMLILNGFLFKKFLTVPKLRELYNTAVKSFPELVDQLENHIGHDRGPIYLNHIHKYLSVIVKRHKNSLYQKDDQQVISIMSTVLTETELTELSASKSFADPSFEMFIWSVLTNKPRLADFFWLRTEHPVVAAIFAATFYGFLHHGMYRTRTTSLILYDLKQYHLENANSIVELAYSRDRVKAIELVERKFERFGNKCILDLAFHGHLKSFIATTPCTDAVSGMWKRGFIELNVKWAILAIFCPFLLMTSKFKFLRLGDYGGELTFLQKIYVFYKAPIVKYLGHTVNYIFFLLLYTSTALFHFNWEFNLIEISVYIWFITLIADEIRELLRQPSKKLASKIRDHIESSWNRLDLLIYAIAVIGFVLKNWKETFSISRVMFAGNVFLLYIRFFRFYHSSLRLGPKVVIMSRMIPEIFSFLLLLIIFILGYGTAREALLNSYNHFEFTYVPKIANDIFFEPLWEMLGELNIEDIKATSNEVCYENSGTFLSFITGEQMTIEGEGEFCEEFTYYTPVVKFFLAVYMLIANVTLLNLLIAVFTTIFSHVQENSKVVWRFEEYRLVEEFSTKPLLPPPFVIFELFNRLLRHFWYKISPPSENETFDYLFLGMLKSINRFEKDCSNLYIKKKLLDDKEKTETSRRLKDVERKLDLLARTSEK